MKLGKQLNKLSFNLIKGFNITTNTPNIMNIIDDTTHEILTGILDVQHIPLINDHITYNINNIIYTGIVTQRDFNYIPRQLIITLSIKLEGNEKHLVLSRI